MLMRVEAELWIDGDGPVVGHVQATDDGDEQNSVNISFYKPGEDQPCATAYLRPVQAGMLAADVIHEARNVVEGMQEKLGSG
jgi:hypothetical protein